MGRTGDNSMTGASLDPTAPIERSAGIALWRQVASRLADLIQAGHFAARLPAEAALATRFGVNRHTVRRAVQVLVAEGLVRVEQGRGMFVEDVVIDYPLRRRTSFSANLLDQGRAPSQEVIALDRIAARGAIAAALGLRAGTSVVRSAALGLADSVPISFGQSYFPSARFPQLLDRLAANASISRVLASYGVDRYRRQSTRILARLPTPEEATRLRQPATQPILVTEAVDVDPSDRPIRYGLTCFAAARVQITVEPDG